jgi:hypothetical protein
MPARRRKQSNAMLYTLITFIGLFIATTTIAVIYYVKAEEHRTRLEDTQREIEELATDRERQALGTIVGTKPGRTTWLGQMVDHLDKTILLVVGGVPEPTSAEVKANNARTEAKNAQNMAKNYIDIGDPNDPNKVDLVQVVKELTAELDMTIKAKLAKEEQLADEQEKFRQALEANFEKEQTLLAEKDKLMQDVNDIEQKYNDLSALLEQTTDEQVKTLRDQLQQARDDLSTLNDALLKTQAELKMAQDMMKRAQDEVAKIEPGPDREVLAYEPDGQVILVDGQAQVVHLNIGSNERVYRGLTFTVYDRGTSVPRDGKGKAEIEVFDVAKTYSAARIMPSGLRTPVLQGDIVANLIWDSDKTNVFVIAGDFDVDYDGQIDNDGVDKIKTLIEKWGGKVGDAISVDTNFLILGKQPQVLKKPTLEELEVDPRATERYDASLQLFNRYTELRSQAQALWIPVFTYEKFLYLIGYKGQVGRAGAF